MRSSRMVKPVILLGVLLSAGIASAAGESLPLDRLTRQEVRAIREDSFERNYPGQTAANKFGISEAEVRKIRELDPGSLTRAIGSAKAAKAREDEEARSVDTDELCREYGRAIRARSGRTESEEKFKVARRRLRRWAVRWPWLAVDESNEAAIMARIPVRGMNACELRAALGEPDRVSRSSHRDTIWIYSPSTFVWVDSNLKVTDWSD